MCSPTVRSSRLPGTDLRQTGFLGRQRLNAALDVMTNPVESPNLKNALIELQHIHLELSNGRAQHLRHFVDQYYCYKNNHVKRTGAAHWESVVWKGNVSREARRLGDRKLVVKEHAVPLRVIRQLLVELSRDGDVTIERIARVLDENVVFATISKDEDRLLRSHGLTSKMPEGFRTPGHVLFGDRLARYKFSGIEME